MLSPAILFMPFCYLLGAAPTGYFLTRWHSGADIRTLGDGNVGAKNVYLSVNPFLGILVAIIDIAKGIGVVVLARAFSPSETWVYVAGVAALLGHDWNIFLGFHGGQGHATTVGILFVLMPRETLISLSIIAFVLILTRNWDISNGVGLAALPIMAWRFGQSWPLVFYPIAILPLIGLRKLLTHPKYPASVSQELNTTDSGVSSPWALTPPKKKP